MGSGSQLSARDGRLTLTLAADFAACRDERDLREQLNALPGRIGADSVLVSGLSGAASHSVFGVGDPGVYRPELVDAVTHHWQDHPVLVADRTWNSRGVRRLSDWVAGSEWRQRGLFAEFYRPLGMSHELSLQLSREPDGSTMCFVLHRGGRDFTDRDRSVLAHLAPHLRAAHARIRADERARERMKLLERGVDRGVVVGRGGHMISAGASARSALGRWFGPLSPMLPAPLWEWLEAARLGHAEPVLELRAGEARLRVELVSGTEEDLVLLTERNAALSPQILAQQLPITPREAEVLARIASGRTNYGIAFDLGISRHTVVRHVEQIYRKLGTHSRAAAVRIALDTLRE